MSGIVKGIDSMQTRRKSSDFGAVVPGCKDQNLRNRVAQAIHTARCDKSKVLDSEELRDIATYISELEETILLHHWGEVGGDDLIGRLRAGTGLDIAKQVSDLNSLLDAD